MRFFSSWWERVRVREAAPTLAAVLVLGGLFSFGSDFAQSILSFVWN